MNQKKIRIGIIGGGGIVKSRHMPGFKKINHVEIVGICNRSQASSQKFANEYQISKVFPTPEALIQSQEIDAVVIGTWPYKHCEYTLKSLAANKHVLVQARMAMNATQAQEMLDASLKKPLLAAMICPSPFGFSADLTIRKLMQERFVGDVLTVRYTNLSAYNDKTPISWRNLREFSGANIMTVGIYYETISRWVGAAQEVFAYNTLNVKERPDPSTTQNTPADIEDDAIIVGKLKNGGSFNYHFGSSQHSPANRIEIYGKNGTILFDFITDQLQIAKKGESLAVVPVEPALKKEWQIEENFIRQIETGEKQEATFEEGLAYMKFTQAVHDSFAKKGLVTLAGVS